ncbi:MAG: curlin repeat-containing protein [Balneolaceae bacterium]|nr:curlin repeat-containing protein [Balneolaceae bacterium]
MMIRKLISTVLIIFLIGSGTVTAQDMEGSVTGGSAESGRSPVSIEQVDRSNIEHTEAVKKFGLDYVFQQNSAAGKIFNSMHLFDGNYAGITVYGDQNSASIEQSGTNNAGFIQMGSPTNLVNNNEAKVYQTGHQLISHINMQGNNNYLLFEQSGTQRGALFNFEGNNLQYSAEQSGSGFQLTPQGGSSPALEIESTRRIVPVIISN